MGNLFSNFFSSFHTIAFTSVSLLVVAILLFRYFQSRKGASACRDWPAASGRVLHSEVQRRRKIGNKTSAYPAVLYQYEVAGRTFQSDRIFPGIQVGGDWVASRKVAKYPAGKTVLVFYNPMNPAEAVLENRAPANLWILLFVLVILFFTLKKFFGFSFGFWL